MKYCISLFLYFLFVVFFFIYFEYLQVCGVFYSTTYGCFVVDNFINSIVKMVQIK